METRIYMNEDAYYRVLKAFAVGPYDFKKELILAKLRTELQITDQRHSTLRKMVEEGKEYEGEEGLDLGKLNSRPTTAASARERGQAATAKRKREMDGFAEEDFARPATYMQPPASPFQQAGSRRLSANAARPAKPATKRQKRDGYGAEEKPAITSYPPFSGDINELIGYKIQRWWPENGGWFEGAITDYRSATGEHCVVYDMNTAAESYEWFNVSKASRNEFRLLNEKINIIEHAPKAGGAAVPSSTPRGPPRKPSCAGRGMANGGGRGRGERLVASHADSKRGRSSQDFDQTAYAVAGGRHNGAAAFTAESEDEVSSDESFSD